MKLHTLLRQCVAVLRDRNASAHDRSDAQAVLCFLWPLRHESELHTPIPTTTA